MNNIKKIRAGIVSNMIEGSERYFVGNEMIDYEFLKVEKNFDPNLDDLDLLIVPNGSDHIAMSKIKTKVIDFLNSGKTVFCFDGWFTHWIPGNQWFMDNKLKSIDLRYSIKDDSHNLFENVDINELIFNHKMSGWWACGYIETAKDAEVIMEDNWHRAIIAIDEKSTNGTIVMTASGPLGDRGAANDNSGEKVHAMTQLYRNMVEMCSKKLNAEMHNV